MRKTFLYLFILALLGFAIWYFLLDNKDNPYNLTEAGFTIKDTGSIGKIFLAANDGESILAERTNDGWMVNKQYKALPSTLNMLLTTLAQQYPLYPITKSAYENAVKNLSTDGVKVEVYDRSGKKMTVFYVGGASVNNSGTNMLMEGARTPYVVQVAGFNGYLTPRFTTKMRDWRDRAIFNLPAEEIKSVSIQYADKPVNSFAVSREGAGIKVNVDPSFSKYAQTLNVNRANLYLTHFTKINAEGYLNGVNQMDSIIRNSHKHSTIDIEKIDGQKQHIDVYWIDINKRSKNLSVSNPDVPDEYDADRLVAITNNYKDTILIQQIVFRPIFRKGYEFFQKDIPFPTTHTQPLQPSQTNQIMHK
jgi:hypothetical protein